MGVQRIAAGKLDQTVSESNRMNPAITVLMSVYNGARWLDEAIVSVLNQTFKDFEFIIVDDGSTDQSLEIIKRFRQLDSRIVVISKSNTGLADSLNCGIQKAHGDWIARLDADDLCEPQRLERQYQLAQSDPSLILIGSGLMVIDEQGRPGRVYRYPSKHDALYRYLIAGKFFAHSSAFFRCESVKNLGGYRATFLRAQDQDLWFRLSETGRFASIGEPLIRYRQHLNMLSNDEFGKPSILYFWMALTSYRLRQLGYSDPVASGNKSFEAFREFVSSQLLKYEVFEYYESVKYFKSSVSFKLLSLESLNRVFQIFYKEPILLWRLIFRSSLPNRLSLKVAREWMALETGNE